MKHLNYPTSDLSFIVSELRAGKIFVLPTDTCFGLVGRIDEETIKRIHLIKKRPDSKFMPIFIRREWAKDYLKFNVRIGKLVNKFWPGALTLIAEANQKKIKGLTPVLGPNNTIGVREPSYDLILKILNSYGEPLTSTSANISGKASCYTLKAVLSQFRNKKYQPDYILDIHSLPKTKSSTIIDITSNKIVREGEIDKNVVTKTLQSLK